METGEDTPAPTEPIDSADMVGYGVAFVMAVAGYFMQ